ncbi:MAG: hypothetical protein U0936_28090 [Planctomycetaceae bacterium]
MPDYYFACAAGISRTYAGAAATAAEKANVLAGGGIMVRSPKESRSGSARQNLTLDEIENTPIVWRGQRAVLLKEVADVRFGGPVKRGDGGAARA